MSNVLNGSLTKNVPIAINRKGSNIITSNGLRTEISGGSHASFLVNSGDSIIEEVKLQLDEIILPLTGRNYNSKTQFELASLISSELADSGSKIFFTSGGTEAVETAIRIAFWLQRMKNRNSEQKIIARTNSYHGMSLYTRFMADHYIHSKQDLGILNSKLTNSFRLKEPNCQSCPYGLNYPNCNLKCAMELERIIAVEDEGSIAAILLEPIGGTTSGAVVPPKDYLETINSICKKHDILFIVDEVVTSFYRCGSIFYTKDIDVDIRIGGKCLSGGYGPIGCVQLSGNLISKIAQFEKIPLRLTFAGNPLMCAIGLNVQRFIKKSGLLNTINSKSDVIRKQLEVFVKNTLNYAFHGFGLLWAIHRKNDNKNVYKLREYYTEHFNSLGLEILTGIRPNENTIHFMFTPPLDISIDEIKRNLYLLTNLLLNESTESDF